MTHRPGLAAIWMLGAVVSFTCMAVAGRYTASELDTFELMMYRSFLGIILVTSVAWARGTLSQISTDRMGLHVVRNILHFTGQNLWFFAITVIPLAQVIALEFTTPIWVILLAPIFLGETLTRTKIAAASLGFIGILIVARPEFGQINSGVLAGAACAVGFAGAMICTKVLTRTTTVTCILFWLVVLQSVFGILTASWDGDVAVPSIRILPWVAVVSVGGLVAHLSITMALTYAPASIVGPVDFIRLPVVAAVGMIVFQEPLEIIILLGAGFILLGNYINLRGSSARGSKKTA